MLSLTRKPGDRIIIGADITIEILGVTGNKVRVGVTAPKDVPVDRSEVRERKNAGVPAKAAGHG